MKLVIQAAPQEEARVEEDALECLRGELGTTAPIRVTRVFPAGTPGRRGRLFLAEADLSLDAALIRRVIERLMSLSSVEDAAPEAPKHPV